MRSVLFECISAKAIGRFCRCFCTGCFGAASSFFLRAFFIGKEFFHPGFSLGFPLFLFCCRLSCLFCPESFLLCGFPFFSGNFLLVFCDFSLYSSGNSLTGITALPFFMKNQNSIGSCSHDRKTFIDFSGLCGKVIRRYSCRESRDSQNKQQFFHIGISIIFKMLYIRLQTIFFQAVWRDIFQKR